MPFIALARKYLACTALTCFVLGGAAALLSVWALGTPWKNERVVEVEKVVERVVVQPAAAPPTARPTNPHRVDLIVMLKNAPLGLDSDISEYFVEETRKLPEVAAVSEGVVSSANVVGQEGVQFLIQGWRSDNFGFDDLGMIEGRKFKPGEERKVMLGSLLAANLHKKVGDKLAFTTDPDNPFEIVGVFKSHVVFEDGGAIVPLKDGQMLTGKRLTGFSVRLKRASPDAPVDVAAAKRKIEALRDPQDPNVRLDAESPGNP